MNATLRDALHGLAPEPPDDLGRPATARRRARTLRRRRIASAGTAVAVAFALVVAGNAVLTGSPGRTVTPTAASGGLVGTFPNWPRRGTNGPGLDQPAIDTWSESVRARGASVVGTPRVLYSGGGGTAVPFVVLHGTAFPGGDRLAVVTFGGGPARVRYDRAAPLPGTAAIAFLVDPPPQGPVGSNGCDTTSDPAKDTWLLVLAAPDVREARWRVTGPPGVECGRAREDVPWQPAVLNGGRAFAGTGGSTFLAVPFRDGNHLDVEARRGGEWVRTDGIGGTAGPYPAFDRMRGIRTPLGWEVRTDVSRAEAVAASLPLPDGVRRDERCELELARSLPDGTAVVLCTFPPGSAGDAKGTRVYVAADDARGRFRTYAFPPGVYTHYATVIEGRTGRWLVFVDRPDQRSAALVENGVTRPIPLEHGTGYLRLAGGEGGPGARITTSDFGPDGGQALTLLEGREVEER